MEDEKVGEPILCVCFINGKKILPNLFWHPPSQYLFKKKITSFYLNFGSKFCLLYLVSIVKRYMNLT